MVTTCAHCRGPLQGYGAITDADGKRSLCHPDTGLDCYSLVTVSGHPTPCDRLDADRRYCEAVDDFFAEITEESP